MSTHKILQPGASYSFRSYFNLPHDTDEIVAEFAYSFTQARLQLPRSSRAIERLHDLRQQIEETLPYVTLHSAAAKREILIAPVLSRVAVICRRILQIEYSLKINEQLQGTLDYFLQSTLSLVVVEAKRDDLTRGFTQLAAELIALAMLEDAPDNPLWRSDHGACMGLWRPGRQRMAGDARPCFLPPYLTMWKTWCGSWWGF